MNPHVMCHYVRLSGQGGVQNQFVDFVRVVEAEFGWRSVLIPSDPEFSDMVRERCPAADTLATTLSKQALGRAGGWLQSTNQRWRRWQRQRIHDSGAAALMFWDRLGGHGAMSAMRAMGAGRCLYWERSSAWAHDVRRIRTMFVKALPAAISVSYAGKRMLELKWGFNGPIRVVPNALRPSVRPTDIGPRAVPLGTWRLGVAARLVPEKGVALALHALAQLNQSGRHVTLDVAGDGPERMRLTELAHRLGVCSITTFHGRVADMGEFYRNIDLLVHPALSECLGGVNFEAGAYGVPAVTAAVDGLPEVVVDGETGLVITPTESVATYVALGGSAKGVPKVVYDPVQDTIQPPRAVAPDRLAAAVAEAFADSARYAAMSAAAIRRADTHYNFETNVELALQACDEFIETGTLQPTVRATTGIGAGAASV